MSQMADGPHLIFQPSWWEIELMDGSLIELRADGAKESSGVHTFVILVEGKPELRTRSFQNTKEGRKTSRRRLAKPPIIVVSELGEGTVMPHDLRRRTASCSVRTGGATQSRPQRRSADAR
jgi:hypothetical protein